MISRRIKDSHNGCLGYYRRTVSAHNLAYTASSSTKNILHCLVGIHLYDSSLDLSKELSKEECNDESEASEEKS